MTGWALIPLLVLIISMAVLLCGAWAMFRRGIKTVPGPSFLLRCVCMNTFGSRARLGPGKTVCRATDLAARLMAMLENLSALLRGNPTLLSATSDIPVPLPLRPSALPVSLRPRCRKLPSDRAILMQTGLSRRMAVSVAVRLPRINVFLAMPDPLT